MIYFYYGDNSLDIKRQLDATVAKFAAEHGADAISKLDAGEIESRQLIAEIVNINLFAPRRLVVVRGAEANKAAWTILGENLARVPDETELFVVAGAPDKRTKTFKLLTKEAKARQFSAPKGAALRSWTLDELARAGVEIKGSVADELIAATGGDQWRMAAEIAKFAALGRVVDKALVRKMVEPDLAASAFQVLDDALNGWRGAALDELAKLRQIEDANKFLGLLASQVYALAAAQASKDKSSTDVARDTGTHAFVMEKMFAVSRRVSGRDVARLAKLVAETDAKMKLGSDGWTLIEVLLAKI